MSQSVNPATGQVIARFDDHGPAEIEQALADAAGAQAAWRRVPVEERVALLRRIAAVLRANLERCALLITQEMGKPLAEARGEIEKCAATCDFYADRAPEFLADRAIASNAAWSGVAYEPLGVILAVMPWNYPFWQFFRFAAPALAAGNGAVLKHAGNVCGCALAIQAVLDEARCPPGLVGVLLIGADKVADLIADDRIAAVTLTGSTEVGAIVAAQAGAALKKQVLELGGSDPFIVLADADVARAAQTAVKARFTNAGQSCVNAKRFLVADAVADAFVAAFLEGVHGLAMGDPLDPETTVGPMARANLREALHGQVTRSTDAGAVLLTGGRIPNGEGFFYPPTVLDRVAPGMAAFEEETFGPVAAITRVADAEDAVRLANQTAFGLAATIWSGDIGRARALASRLEAGAVFINGIVASDARLPFGGVKKSGYGRELGDYGIREFVNIKTLWIGDAA